MFSAKRHALRAIQRTDLMPKLEYIAVFFAVFQRHFACFLAEDSVNMS
jgi:hypothetical protein